MSIRVGDVISIGSRRYPLIECFPEQTRKRQRAGSPALGNSEESFQFMYEKEVAKNGTLRAEKSELETTNQELSYRLKATLESHSKRVTELTREHSEREAELERALATNRCALQRLRRENQVASDVTRDAREQLRSALGLLQRVECAEPSHGEEVTQNSEVAEDAAEDAAHLGFGGVVDYQEGQDPDATQCDTC
jgi:hypothetical protein